MADNIDNNSPDSYMYWDTLNFIPTEDKNEEWFARMLYFVKNNFEPLIDQETAKRMRQLELAIMNPDEYKKILDPKTPDGGGGKAEYFAADWKSCPVYVRLNNIVDEEILGIPRNAQVKAADEFSKPRQMKRNEKIIGRNYMRAFLNEFNRDLGIPPISTSEDPFRYVDQMQGSDKSKNKKPVPPNAMDSIMAAIQDDETLGLWNEYIDKDGVEIAFEKAIQMYDVLNKMDETYERMIRDHKNFGCHALRYYTSATTGQPVYEYMDPVTVNTNPMPKRTRYQGDCIYWFNEEYTTFGDFVRKFGGIIKQQCQATNRSYEETMKEIFELNRKNAGVAPAGKSWDECTTIQRNSTKMLIGYMECETQDMDVFSERTINGNTRFKKVDSNWYPSKDSQKRYSAKRVEAHYNVWYRGWYIPLSGGSALVPTTDFTKQAKYIFNFGKVQDQQREGDDNRYVKCSLFGVRSDKVSFGEILDRFMGKINLLWLHFQNNLANIMPNGTAYAEELLNSMMESSDDAAKEGGGKDTKFEAIRRMRQTGEALFQAMDDNGNYVQPNALVFSMSNSNVKGAVDNLNLMMQVYQLATSALSVNDIRQGQDPLPRQSFGATQLAYSQSMKGNAYLQRPIMYTYIENCWRSMYFVYELVQSNDKYRMQELADQIGQAQVMELMAIKDLPLHNLALKVANVMTDEQRARIMNTVDRMAAAGTLDPAMALFISRIDDLQYAEAIIRIFQKKAQREAAALAATNHKYVMDEAAAEQRTEILKIQAKGANQLQDTQMRKQWDYRIQQEADAAKTQSQAKQIDQRAQNKNQQILLDSDLSQREEQQKPL